MHFDAAEVTDELTYDQVKDMLGCSIRTAYRLRAEGILTPVVRRTPRGRKEVRFRRADVEALAASDASDTAVPA